MEKPITINIHSLIDKIIIINKDDAKSIEDINEMVLKSLLKVLEDASEAAKQG